MVDIKISELPAAVSAADGNEYEINEAGTSKKVTGLQLKTYMSGALVYAARVTQTGAGAPTAVVSANTTGATVAWTRIGGGYSAATFSAAVLTSGKTNVQHNVCGSGGYTDPKYGAKQQASATVVNFGSFRYSDDTAEDGWVMDVIIYIFP